MKPFTLLSPTSLAEAVAMLDGHGPDARVLAGGQTLLLAMKDRTARPSTLVSLAKVPGLNGIVADVAETRIGATTTYAEVASATFDGWQRELARVAGDLADRPVRNMGTLGGALCSGDPRYDMPVLMVGVDAAVTVVSATGSNTLAVQEFLSSEGTADRSDRILTEILLPPVSRFTGVAFEKFRHRIFESAVASVVCAVHIDEGGAIREARVAVGAIAPEPILAAHAGSQLVGRQADAVDFDAVSAHLAEETVTAERVMTGRQGRYQDALLPTLVRRAVRRALQSKPESAAGALQEA